MSPNLAEPLEHVLRPLFQALPINRAMPDLVVPKGVEPPADHVRLVEQLLADPAMKDKPVIAAGLWLYVDQLDRSQKVQSPAGSFWHAIMHRREGDFSNSHHWYRRAGRHPAMSRIDVGGGSAASGTTIGGYDPHDFVDRVERAHKRGQNRQAELVATQRREWMQLFEWCAEHA